MRNILGVLVALGGMIGTIGSYIAMRFSGTTIIVMSILNILSIITIPWFAGITTAGAISTGLWMFLIGFICMILGALITIIGRSLID